MKKAIILMLFISQTFATCLNTNLYKTNKNLNNHQIYNQGNSHTCYAQSLAQLYNVEFLAYQNISIDPYFIATIHKDRVIHWSPRNMDYSLLSWAYSDIKKSGFCSSQETQDLINQYKPDQRFSNDQFFYLLKIYFKNKGNLAKIMKKLESEKNKFEITWGSKQVVRLSNSISIRDNRDYFNFIKNNIYGSCKRYGINEELVNTARGSESNETLLGLISNQLNDNKPLSIGLCSDAVYDDNFDIDITIKPRILKVASKKCGAHYMMIVGSRNNTRSKSCELLVRNSHGKKYWSKNKQIECTCDNSNELSKCEKDSQNVVGCWIESNKVLNNTYDISYFN